MRLNADGLNAARRKIIAPPCAAYDSVLSNVYDRLSVYQGA